MDGFGPLTPSDILLSRWRDAGVRTSRPSGRLLQPAGPIRYYPKGQPAVRSVLGDIVRPPAESPQVLAVRIDGSE